MRGEEHRYLRLSRVLLGFHLLKSTVGGRPERIREASYLCTNRHRAA